MWSAEGNHSIFPQFINEIGKSSSKGAWYDDYHDICQQQHLIPCPFVKIERINNDQSNPITSCKIMNCILDTGTWRAILVACSTIGNTIIELCLHNVRISSHHIDDLCHLFKSTETIQSLKLDYLNIHGDLATFYSSLKNFLSSNTTGLRYFSFVGNDLTDQNLLELLVPLRNHCTLDGINLNHNQITDHGFISFLQILPYTIHLNSFSFKSNLLTGQSLNSLIQILFIGLNYNNENENEIKLLNKIIQERNKYIKEINKKLKKESKDGGGGFSEVPELELLTNRIFKQHENSSLICNHSLRFLDLSWNREITWPEIVTFQSNANSTLENLLNNHNNNNTAAAVVASPRKETGGSTSPVHHHETILTLCLRGLSGGEGGGSTGGFPNEEIIHGRLKLIM